MMYTPNIGEATAKEIINSLKEKNGSEKKRKAMLSVKIKKPKKKT